jgi:hypothetical protein
MLPRPRRTDTCARWRAGDAEIAAALSDLVAHDDPAKPPRSIVARHWCRTRIACSGRYPDDHPEGDTDGCLPDHHGDCLPAEEAERLEEGKVTAAGPQ